MKSYRVIIVGPTGAGKSQFCNFARRDLKNSFNKVRDSLNSCTQDPLSNNFTRNNTNYEFIDTAGSSDSSNNDIKNLEKLVNYLKIKKEIDYIILLLKFNEKVTKETRDYIDTLGKIFTPGEFYTHLCVFFTKFPNQPTKKENKTKTKSIEEINEILKETFNLQKNEKIPNVNVYFIDTEHDEDENSFTYDEKGQDTIDIMMEQMKLDVDIYHSINTTNIDMTGVNAKIRAENNRKEILKLLEEEKRKREREEADKRRLEEEIKRQKKNDEERRRKEKELEELIKKQKEEKKRLEEIARENKRKEEENEKRRKMIEEEARKKGIEIAKLDNIIDECGEFAKRSAAVGGASLLLGLGGLALTAACPVAGPIIAAFFLGGAGGCALETAGAGIIAAGSKIAKERKK
jgi:DNA repair exonuclease SbcCD ATPase subunit